MWKFNATNLGKITAAEVEVAPLVLFVGRNNTGKSYLATAMWALSSVPQILSVMDEPDAMRFEWNDIKRPAFAEGFRLEVTQAMANEAVQRLNQALRNKTSDFLSEIFAFKGLKDTTLSLSLPESFEPFRISITQPAGEGEKRPFLQMRVEKKPSVNITYRFPPMQADEITRQAQRRIFAEVIRHSQSGRTAASGGTIYIPAARTGLMLSYPALIAQLFEPEGPPIPFPRPVIDFLQRLSLGFSPRGRQTNQITTWMERNILKGNLEYEEAEAYKVNYIPENTQVSIPLHVASSMVTEMVPILLAIRSAPTVSQIILEEPEAHLHLSAQREMARAIARLLNSGIRVTVTTHSDTFVQQINNLMQIYKHPKREDLLRELGYDEIDLINPEHARAYEFLSAPSGSVVNEVDRSPEGFIVTSLNDTLFALAKETIRVGAEGE